jgi:hypothetical protein
LGLGAGVGELFVKLVANVDLPAFRENPHSVFGISQRLDEAFSRTYFSIAA